MKENQNGYIQSLTNQKIVIPNILVISGDGRKVGKTTLGCRIVKSLSFKSNVFAIKISPHSHPVTDSLEVLKREDFFMIARETDKTSNKDSSRYLNSGAAEVFYIQCEEQGLPALAEWIQSSFSEGDPIICEAGGLLNFVTPGYSIYIKSGWGSNIETSGKEIVYNNLHPEDMHSSIIWENGKWKK